MSEELANHALQLTLPPDEAVQAASEIIAILNRDNYEKPPKEVVDVVVAKSLEALCMFSSLNPTQNIRQITVKLFNIIARFSADRKNREAIFAVAHDSGIFDHVINITYSTMRSENATWEVAFHNAAVFLYYFSLDDNSEYSEKIRRDISSDKEFFSLMFKKAVRWPTSQGGALFVSTMLHYRGEILRETIGEHEVKMLLNGTRNQPGLLAEAIRRGMEGTVYNALRVIDLLIRTSDLPTATAHTKSLRQWFIKYYVFGFLVKAIRMEHAAVTTEALQIIVFLLDTGDISRDVRGHITNQARMASDHLLALKSPQHQYLHLRALNLLIARGTVLQKILTKQKVFNWICSMLTTQANKEPIKDDIQAKLLQEALGFCCSLLHLVASPESGQLWQEEGVKEKCINPNVDSKFASGLINILAHGNKQVLHEKTIQVILAALALPTDRFAPILFHAVDDSATGMNVAAALFNAVNNAMRISADIPNVLLIQSAVDLLEKLFDDEALEKTLIHLAATNTTHSPLNILSCPDGNSSTIFFMNSEPFRSSDDLFVMSTENQALCDSIAEYVESNTFHFPLNMLFCSIFESEKTLKIKLLKICKKMLLNEDLKDMWAPFREKFKKISGSGSDEMAAIASEICALF